MSRSEVLRSVCAAMVTFALATQSLPAVALAANGGPAGGGVSVTSDAAAHTVTIGNGDISRTFSTADGRLATTLLSNGRAGVTFDPADGSEEFVVRVVRQASAGKPAAPEALSREGWTAADDSHAKAGNSDGPAQLLLDGDVNTNWSTWYQDGNGVDGQRQEYPFSVVIDLNGEKSFSAFSMTPRPQGPAINGNSKGYKLYVSTSAEKLDAGSAAWGNPVAEGEFAYDGTDPAYVNLDHAQTATQVKLVVTSNTAGNNIAGGAEFNLYPTAVAMPTNELEFSASNLELAGDPVVTDTTATINGKAKTGKKLTFNFRPYAFGGNGVTYTISENIVMYEGDHYMRKYLDISVPANQAARAAIDYIDLERLGTSAADATWTIPHVGGVVQMDQFKANLGQPIYIQGMFFGCEFPATDTQIEDGLGHIRYYTGKDFNRLVADSQAAADDAGNIHYNTWQTVAGAARSTDASVVQSDFFDYINDIATPSEFRIQYNSWFDNMMKIDDKNIHDSFIEVDAQLDAVETRPLDSYVVDDGWNNYNNADASVDVSKSGVGKNTEGFWAFNSKFPQGLTPSSKLVENFGSSFGVWVGPRGGYNFYSNLADILTASGRGSKAGWSIDVADRTYVRNFLEMACDWQDRYGVNYWKWDGFVDKAQYAHFGAARDGVPGYANNHMTGGYNNMYHVTDLWEAWIDLFEGVRANAAKNGIDDLWISLTCYVNPSPWFLQWANSVWIQDVYDQTDAGEGDSKLDRQLNYRDAMYYDFIKNHQFQFPLSSVYNHDPIYGKEGTNITRDTATDEQFQNYLYAQSGRGTAFWELYYSESLMTQGKWEVTAEFLDWAEQNHHVLSKAKMFGGSPASNARLDSTNTSGAAHTYGYSAFDGEQGIVVLRNPATSSQQVSYAFNDTNGVPAGSGSYVYHIEHAHKHDESHDGIAQTGTLEYGTTYTWTLDAGEVLVLMVSKEADTQAPAIERVYSDGAGNLTVRFDEKVTGSPEFTVNGERLSGASVTASADDATFHLALGSTPEDGTRLEVAVAGLADLSGNSADGATGSVVFRAGGVVVERGATRLGTSPKTIAPAEGALDSPNGFTVYSRFAGSGAGALVSQADGYELGIESDGTPYFSLGEARATSSAVVNDGQPHTLAGVRENNGMLKLYVDGKLAGSSWRAENRYRKVSPAPILLGGGSLAGSATAKVFDSAYAYDDVARLHDADLPDSSERNLASGVVPTASWTADGSAAKTNADRPLSNITDGLKDDTNNYGEFGDDNRAEGSYVELDLGSVYDISGVNLWRYWLDRRVYENTVVALSQSEDFSSPTVLYNSDAGNAQGLGAGSDETYEETPSGRSWTAPEGTRARYVRVYMHGRANGQGNTNHIVELEVMGHASAAATDPIDVSELDARIAELDQLLSADSEHTTSSVATVAEQVARAREVADYPQTKENVAAALATLADIEKSLVPRADPAAANALLSQLDGAALEEGDYTPESWAALGKARAAVEAVLADLSDVSQSELDALVEALAAAREGLAPAGEEGPRGPEVPADPGDEGGSADVSQPQGPGDAGTTGGSNVPGDDKASSGSNAPGDDKTAGDAASRRATDRPVAPARPTVPNTGDQAGVALSMALVAAGACLGLLGTIWRRRPM